MYESFNFKRIFAQIAAFVLVFFMFSFFGCSKKNKDLTVAVTIMPQKQIVDSVSGGTVKTVVVVPAGSSPESYDISASKMLKISNADLYFQIGVPVEDSGAIKSLSKNAIKTHQIIRQIYLEESGYDDLTFDSVRDHHIWLSIPRMIIHTDIVAQKLIELDSNNKDLYLSNALEYKNRLNNLHLENIGLFSNCAKKQIFTDHPAFLYLAFDYGLEMFSIESGGDLRPKEIQNYIDLAKSYDISVFFFNELESAVNKNAIKNDIPSATFINLNPLAENYLENYKDMAQKIYGALNG